MGFLLAHKSARSEGLDALFAWGEKEFYFQNPKLSPVLLSKADT